MQYVQSNRDQSYLNAHNYLNNKDNLPIIYADNKHVPIFVPVKSIGQRVSIPVHHTSEKIESEKTLPLSERCILWCMQTYGNRAIIQEMPQAQTFVLIIPHSGVYFVQFAHPKQPLSIRQYQFQGAVDPIPVFVFRSFRSFALFLKRKMYYDS